jgi:sulfonate transport system substrate-binding protein
MYPWKRDSKSWQNSPINRRSILIALGCLAISTTLFSCNNPQNNSQQQNNSSSSTTTPNTNDVSASSNSSGANQKVVRVDRVKQLSAIAVLEKWGILEKRLKPLGYKVEWPEFAAGPQELEAINAGGLDIAFTAESPLIFSQAAGIPLVYLAATSSDGQTISLLVPTNSNFKNVKDLKGKKVAFQKASIGHYLLVRALEKAGMKLNDVQSVFLAPPDANVAFNQGRVDGWFIWEPFVTRNVQNKVGRVLVDGSNGLRDTSNFISSSRKFYEENPQVIKIILEELQKAEIWSKDHPQEIAKLLAPVTKLDPPTLEKMHSKYDFTLIPITNEVIQKQQQVADLWYRLGLIPKKVNVKEDFLTPEQYAEITPKDVLARK